jgi:hypothetical protein
MKVQFAANYQNRKLMQWQKFMTEDYLKSIQKNLQKACDRSHYRAFKNLL